MAKNISFTFGSSFHKSRFDLTIIFFKNLICTSVGIKIYIHGYPADPSKGAICCLPYSAQCHVYGTFIITFNEISQYQKSESLICANICANICFFLNAAQSIAKTEQAPMSCKNWKYRNSPFLCKLPLLLTIGINYSGN